MSAVTKPMALDSTLQDVADALPSPAQGAAGKTAYASAVSGEYALPEGQFNADLEGLKWRCNPNLMDNAYFVGGGDQQGGGQFPINSKKQTSYSGANAYAIDGAYLNSGANLTLASDGIIIETANDTSYARGIRIPIENAKNLRNKTVTLSALVANADADFYLNVFGGDAYRSLSVTLLSDAAFNSAGLYSTSGMLESTKACFTVFIGARNPNQGVGTGKSAKIIAAKLELGSEQTLAHLENGVWVLNEIPDYETQLLRCQRFYRVFTANTAASTGYGYSTNAKDLRPEMRANPTAETFTVDGVTYYALNANL